MRGKMTAQAIHVGDKVKFRLGGRDAVGQVREDRGPIGVGGRRLYLFHELGRDNWYSVEMPAAEIEVVSKEAAG
jgi:hypothetical protein